MPRKKATQTRASNSKKKSKVVEEEEEAEEAEEKEEEEIIEEVVPKKAKLTNSRKSLRGSSKGVKVTEESLFEQYQDDSKENIDPYGMERLFNDLEINPESFEALCFCYKLNADKMGYFTKDEFLEGLKSMKCTTLSQLQKHLKSVRKEFDDPVSFKSLYEFAFKFCKGENKDTRTIESEAGKEMLKCVLGQRYPITAKFAEFLKQSPTHKALNMDQWRMFYEFVRKVKPDLSDYYETDCWPVVIDDFVDWLKKKDTPSTDAN